MGETFLVKTAAALLATVLFWFFVDPTESPYGDKPWFQSYVPPSCSVDTTDHCEVPKRTGKNLDLTIEEIQSEEETKTDH